MSKPSQEWYRDNYLISTSRNLIQPDVVNDAFASDDLYWAKRLPEEQLKKMLSNSFNLGLYALPESSSAIAGRQNPRQIGLARIITDEVSIAYLTDVFVNPEFRGKGLGKWLLQCVAETLDNWPHLRRSILVTSGEQTKLLYKDLLGMGQLPSEGGLVFMTKTGQGWPENETKH